MTSGANVAGPSGSGAGPARGRNARAAGAAAERAAAPTVAGGPAAEDEGSVGSDEGSFAPVERDTARIHPVTLSISPAALERAFWRDVGLPAYALADRYAYSATILNTLALWRNLRNASGARWLLDACPSALTAAVHWAHVLPLYVACGSLALAVGFQPFYRRIRDPVVIVQRLVRAINTPLFPACTSAAAYGRRIAHELAGGGVGGPAPVAPMWLAIKHVSLFGVLWTVQILLFAFRFKWSAPLQLAAATVGVTQMRSLACALRSHAAVAAAAARLCGLIEMISAGTLALGAPKLDEVWSVCSVAAFEFWVVLVFFLSSILPLYFLYCREHHLKTRYLTTLGLAPCAAAPFGMPLALRHAGAVIGAIVASVWTADLAVALGWRFDCSY